MSKNKTVKKNEPQTEQLQIQNSSYKETLEPDFEFIMKILCFGANCITEEGELDVQDLLFVESSQFTPSQLEIIENFKKYVLLDKYGIDDVVNIEFLEGNKH